MSDTEIFLCGALGAMLGAFIVQLLPFGYALACGHVDHVPFTFARLVGIVIVAVGLTAVGGLAALGLGGAATPTEPIHAIAYGLGWQSTIGGLLNARSASQSASRTSVGLSQDGTVGS